MANSGSGGVFQCFGPLDRQTSLALITSYGGYVKSLVYEAPVNSAEDLVACIAAAAGKSGTRPVFSLTFDLQCAGDVRPASLPVISNTYFGDDRCLFNVLSFLLY
ncbi:hypothetical protein AVEN_27602-1 [Araneus ventricosus]|uniref:Uncharacterized protein n=1 Tax=Araneus ventricosus TaxID=182803 RepID=A0A4Y2EMP8_ARAVE|nr:hypothetical protein AVEN_27602-1 [Araneus ventricosus]